MNLKKPQPNKMDIDEKFKKLMDVDKDIHEPVRLMILSYLAVVESVDLVFLRGQTGLTWGNLAAHISKLEQKEYIITEKEDKPKKPHTMVKLTEKGKQAFHRYRKNMENIF